MIGYVCRSRQIPVTALKTTEGKQGYLMMYTY